MLVNVVQTLLPALTGFNQDQMLNSVPGSLPVSEANEVAPYRVLIIDDAETDRQTYRRYLSRSSKARYTVTEAEDGESALALCPSLAVDLILLDYRLPDIDGLALFQQLQSVLSPMPPVIMLTGEGSEQVAVEALKAGVQDYVVKGNLRPQTFGQTIRRVLAQWQLQQSIARQQSQRRLLTDVALRISQSLDIKQTLSITVNGIRDLLDCDRALIYQFKSDMSGTVVAESVLQGLTQSQGKIIEDTCFQEKGADQYFKGRKSVINNIYESYLTACHIKLLEQFEVKANLVTPIVFRDLANTADVRLWGLLIAHHCHSPHIWQQEELSLVDDLAVQLAVALQQTELIQTLKRRAQRLSSINKELRRTTKLLKTRNAQLDEFAYVASHDLKAPLRAIKNLAEWLEDDLEGKLPEENQQQLCLMQSRVQRMEGFIEGLLQYSRAGRESLEAVLIDSRVLISEIIENLSPSQTVTVEIPEGMPLIQTQKLLLEQVLSNLIGNAAKYHNRPDGKIKITVKELDNVVQFTVADDGPGIDPQYHERIFGVFQTLTSRDVLESTGIGLSIVKKLVEQQDGEITLVSELGNGSTFSFTWPKISQSHSNQALSSDTL